MKKLYFVKTILLACVSSALLLACQKDNQESSARYDVNVKVIPADVIAPFTYELNPGDLTKIADGYKIRVGLRVYDKDGFLVEKKINYLQNYDAISNFTFSLNSGSYTLLATTDIVEYDGSNVTFEYWNFGKGANDTDDQKLSELQIVDNGYIGSMGKKSLGVTSTGISVIDAAFDTNIKVKPACALAVIYFKNIHTYSEIKSLELETSKLGDYLFFNGSGQYDISFKWPGKNQYFRLNSIDVEDYSKYNGIYSYVFLLPGDKYELTPRYITTDDSQGYLVDDSKVLNIKKGEEYEMIIDCKDSSTGSPAFTISKVGGSKSSFGFACDACMAPCSGELIVKNVSE